MRFFVKISIWFLATLLILIGPVMAAETCQDDCSVFTKFGDVTISTHPDANFQWPIVVSEPGVYRCDDPNAPNPDNYPCLAWPYICSSGPCEKITKVSVLIPNCCDRPISVLWTNQGAPDTKSCDENGAVFPNVCSGYELRIENISGANPPPEGSFWFTTPKDIGTGMNDQNYPVQGKDTTCLTAIKGPSCNVPLPKVRVEPRVQCFQFTAENDLCQEAQTWYAEWSGSDPCAVDVWVADGVVACTDVKTQGTKLEGEPFGDIKIIVDGQEQILTEALTNNSQCDEGWLRFVDDQGCNARCYYSGGRKYCR